MKITLLTLSLLVFQNVASQNSLEPYYNQFDKYTDSYASDLNNGKRFEDIYLTESPDQFRFFVSKEAGIGNVTYKNQFFYHCLLKYDLFEDQLTYKNTTDDSKYDIVLDKHLVDSFTIHGKKFTKLPLQAAKFSFYKNGYFESVAQFNSFKIFVKHDKVQKKRLGDKTTYYIYSKKEYYILEYKNDFFEIDSKNDIVKVLPEKKEDIKDFFKNNNQLKSQNKTEFMTRLFKLLAINN